jgi:GH15 family glucan-1,4-alpha-glucosidase
VRISQPPIDEYALIGDTRTAALVSASGCLDWLCLPRFDGEVVFGRLLDLDRGGCFLMGPATSATVVSRGYLPDTTTVRTTWGVAGARLTLTEGMPAELGTALSPRSLLVRRLESHGGPVLARIRFDPRGGWSGRRARIDRRAGVLVWTCGPIALGLQVDPAVEIVPGRDLLVEVAPERPLTAVVAMDSHAPLVHVPPRHGWQLLTAGEDWWRRWCGEIAGPIPFRDTVIRSVLTLRLLTYAPSGAPVAAPTTSLPELVGGARNWDYRLSWPRDASIGIQAFLDLNKPAEARSYLYWLLHASRLTRPRLPPMLTVFGRPAPRERELASWPGYADSRPVRVGNAANEQHQLDVYGWVVDAAWTLRSAGHPLAGEVWRTLTAFTDFVAGCWRWPDSGIWEVRGEPRHYVHSKLMAWLALDRALRLAGHYRTRTGRIRRWTAARDAVAAQIRGRGFDPVRRTYLRAYGSDEVDAALLLLPALGFDDPTSAPVAGTVAAVRERLGAGGPLLYRYPVGHDGLTGAEGAFLPCTYWLVTALARTGQVDEAARVFEQTLTLSPLGLFAEEVDPSTGRQVGNYPQALTHASLVQAALAIRDAADRRGTARAGR